MDSSQYNFTGYQGSSYRGMIVPGRKSRTSVPYVGIEQSAGVASSHQSYDGSSANFLDGSQPFGRRSGYRMGALSFEQGITGNEWVNSGSGSRKKLNQRGSSKKAQLTSDFDLFSQDFNQTMHYLDKTCASSEAMGELVTCSQCFAVFPSGAKLQQHFVSVHLTMRDQELTMRHGGILLPFSEDPLAQDLLHNVKEMESMQRSGCGSMASQNQFSAGGLFV